MTQISLIVAMNHERVIGVNNQLPWHISEDLSHFKRITMNHPILMGRKTFESIGRVLPGRKNIVITTNSKWQANGVEVFHDVNTAIKANLNQEQIFIIGGAQIFNQTLDIANNLYLTIVDMPVANADTFFPIINFNNWVEISVEHIVTKNKIACSFYHYSKK
jgi:dihydrofolate reductase